MGSKKRNFQEFSNKKNAKMALCKVTGVGSEPTTSNIMSNFLDFGTFYPQASHFCLAWGTLVWRSRTIFGYELCVVWL